jgi:hypothetical protein
MPRHTSAEPASGPQQGICRVGGFIAESLVPRRAEPWVRKDPALSSARFFRWLRDVQILFLMLI